jgi:SAM-dependent methyltransferase
MQSVRQKTFLLLIFLGISVCLFLPLHQGYVKDELNLISEYERVQSSKLLSPKWFQRIQKIDSEIIQPQLRKRFRTVFKEREFEVHGKTALCVGSRLGGEVRALQDLGVLAIGIDFNPGERNKHVLYGSAIDLQFPSGVFDIIYSNILDHIQDIELFFREVSRVAKRDSLLLLDLDQNSPDRWSVRDLRGRVDEFSDLVQSNGWILLTKKVIRNEKDKGKVALVFSKER